MPVKALKTFLRLESVGGFMLIGATVLAMGVANSPLSGVYTAVLETRLAVLLGDLALDKPLLLWVNDGLMALFFLLIGLEIKREVLEGQLSTRDQLALPVIGATGGFLVPAGIYAWINYGNEEAIGGWAIPAATDIAFALGILSLLGSRVPLGLKAFLTSLAIFDDVGAIVVIALFYSQDLSILSMLLACVGLLGLAALNICGVSRIAPYCIVGLMLWTCVLQSGVHATLAGILVATAVPLKSRSGESSPLRELEHALHPWVAFAILPLFAFANAGVSMAGISSEVVFGTVSVGIILGLFVGKQLGVFVAVWLAVKFDLAKLPGGSNWSAVYGVALLTGIGFTMSLFIGSLAFEHGNFEHLTSTRVGVLAGSLLSAVVGYMVLHRSLPPERRR